MTGPGNGSDRAAPPPTKVEPARPPRLPDGLLDTIVERGRPNRRRPPEDEWGPGRLPRILADRYRLPAGAAWEASGGEAELLLVEPVQPIAGITGEQPRRCVLKLYSPTGVGPEPGIWEFLESRPHKHIVRLYERGKAANRNFEVMEYAAGGNLYQLRTHPANSCDRGTLRRVVEQAVEALGAAHRHSVIHRDLKPANILLRSRPGEALDIAITDFGISSIIEDNEHYLTRRDASTEYASPEFLMSGKAGPATDYWALGMLVAELYLGRHPLHIALGEDLGRPSPDEDPDRLRRNVIGEAIIARPVDLSGVIDTDIQTLCRGLLFRDAARRWGYQEVKLWLDDKAPPVPYDDVAPDWVPPVPPEPQILPFAFLGSQFVNQKLLANTLTRRWSESSRRLFEPTEWSWQRLAVWLEQFDDGDDSVQARLQLAVDLEGGVPARVKLLRLIRFLDPFAPAVYDGFEVSQDELYTLALRIFRGEPGGQLGILSDLWDYRLLAAFERSELRRVDMRWRALHRQAADRVADLRERYPELDEVLPAIPEETLLAGLLLLAGNGVEIIRREAEQVPRRVRTSVPWFAELIRPEASGVDLFLACLLRLRAEAAADRIRQDRRRQEQHQRVWDQHSRMRALIWRQSLPVAIGWASIAVIFITALLTTAISIADGLPFVSDPDIARAWLWSVAAIVVITAGEYWVAARTIGRYMQAYAILRIFAARGAGPAEYVRTHRLVGVLLFAALMALLVGGIVVQPALIPTGLAAAQLAWVVVRERAWREELRQEDLERIRNREARLAAVREVEEVR